MLIEENPELPGFDLSEEQIEALYPEVKAMARRFMGREWQAQSIQTTLLADDALLRAVRYDLSKITDKEHFLNLLSIIMRRILIQYARLRRAKKRGGGLRRTELTDGAAFAKGDVDPLIEDVLAELDLLASTMPVACRIFELYYLGQLTHEEIADLMKVSVSTVKREINKVRIQLKRSFNVPDAR